jgi:RNA polymerase sigma factor (sigma-70 family)
MSRSPREVVDQVERLWGEGTLRGLNPEQLLGRFVARRDEEAFASLVAHFGPMVQSVCRGVLGDRHAADDAFQATFLLLARKAASVRQAGQLGGWLLRVARRVAVRAARQSARRPERTGLHVVGEGPAAPTPTDAFEPDLARSLHEEVDRLPASHRMAVVVCDLEGLTHQQAADRLQWPVGTVKGRLFRARRTLRDRLSRRGIVASAAVLAAGRSAKAAVSPSLVESTARLAAAVASGSLGSTSTPVPARVAALAAGEAQIMMIRSLVYVIGFSVAGAGLAAGAVGLAGPTAQEKGTAAQTQSRAAKGTGGPANAGASDDLAAALAKRLTAAERQQLLADQDNLQLEIELLELEVGGIRSRLLGELTMRRGNAQRAMQQFDTDPEGMTRQYQPNQSGKPGGEVSKEEIERQRIKLQSVLRLTLDEMKEVQEEYRSASERLHKMKVLAAEFTERLQAPNAEPRRIRPGDVLLIEVLEALPGRPIAGERRVRSDGTISLGWYGDLPVAGLNRVQAKIELIRHLQKSLSDESLGLIRTDEQSGVRIKVPPEESDRVVVDDSLADAEDSRNAGARGVSAPRLRDAPRARSE